MSFKTGRFLFDIDLLTGMIAISMERTMKPRHEHGDRFHFDIDLAYIQKNEHSFKRLEDHFKQHGWRWKSCIHNV